MSVFFNFARVRELELAYEGTIDAITASTLHLEPLLRDAHTLLGHPTMGRAFAITSELEIIASELGLDRRDLALRDFRLQRADERMAFMLSIRAGRFISFDLASSALASGWSYDEAVLRHELDMLMAGPRPFNARELRRLTELRSALEQIESPFSIGGRTGDLDANFLDPRVGEPLRLTAATPLERGRDLLIRSLRDTANPDAILEDEFEVFLHENGNLTIVLPGVTDLSDPHLGNDPHTNTLRDVDQQAITSAVSNGLFFNGFARRVDQWASEMIESGVIETGASTLIIGHSFGGDTAFDLTSDTRFNGELLNVTHAVSFAYFNEPQFKDLPDTTRVVSAQNIFDLVTAGEALPRNATPITLVHVGHRVAGPVINSVTRAANGVADRLEDAAENVGVEVEIGEVLEVQGDHVTELEPNGLNILFDGDFDLTGVGHDQDAYVDFVASNTHPAFEEFLQELDAHGYTDNAVTLSVDISEPVENRQSWTLFE